jgi:hypothetical protein
MHHQKLGSNKAYGVERWLAELALALGEVTYRPEPLRESITLIGRGGPQN